MTEEQLLNELKSGVIRRIYYLHGKESFLVQTYAKRILAKCLPESERDFNLIRFSGVPEISAFADAVQTLPVFADKRVVTVNDLDVDKMLKDPLEELLGVVEQVPPETCLIFYNTGFVHDMKKANANLKKLFACLEKYGKNAAVISFEKISDIYNAIARRASQKGCTISRHNAAHLADLCLNNYTLIIQELEKLCAFAGYSGEITMDSIEKLTTKQLETKTFALADAVVGKRGNRAMEILDELVVQGEKPFMIIAALAATFLDFYRAKIAGDRPSPQIIKDFNAATRARLMPSAIQTARRMSLEQTRDCVRVLCDADYKLKSSPIDDRVIMERAIAELLTLC
jgi:DNA polymerase-3 subunit delta